MRARSFIEVSGSAVRSAALAMALALVASPAWSQVTPITGTLTGGEGGSREQAADDILQEAIKANNQAGSRTAGFTSFALGRIRSTEHEGYQASQLGKSVAYDAEERSIFGAVSYRTPGFQPNSRLSISAYVGQTSLELKLGNQTTSFAGLTSTGTSDNTALLTGVTLAYSIGNLYAAGNFTYFDGTTNVNQTTGGLATLGTSFDTSGFMVNGAIGNSYEIAKLGSMPLFVNVEGGVRHVDMKSDRFSNRGGTALFEADFVSTVGSATVGLFGVVPMGTVVARPFVRGTLLRDFQYDNSQVVFSTAGVHLDTIDYYRSANTRQVEGGVSFVQGNLSYSASAFTEWSSDHDTVGAKVGLRYDF